MAIGSLVAARPARAQVWKNYNNENFCLGVAAGNVTNGTNLIVWDCDGHPNQSWTTHNVGGNYVELQDSVNTNKCAGLSGGNISWGTPLIIWDCLGATDQDQSWEPVFVWQDRNLHNCYYFQNYKVAEQEELVGVFGPEQYTRDGEKVVLQQLGTTVPPGYYYNPAQYWCAY